MTAYCSIADVEWVLQKRDLPETWSTDLVEAAIEAQTEWVEKNTKRHWFVSGGAPDDAEGLIDSTPNTRQDEYDIPTHAGFVHGASEDDDRRRQRKNSDALLEAGTRYEARRERYRDRKREIKIATGDVNAVRPPTDDGPAYTKIRLNRKDVTDVTQLLVIGADGSYTDWTSTKTGGVGLAHRGEDWYVYVGNRGVAELYLDVHAMDDEIHSFSNAVYADFEYGHDGIPTGVRRGVAQLAAAQLVLDDEAAVAVADAGQLINVETKHEAYERMAIAEDSHLEPHLEPDW